MIEGQGRSNDGEVRSSSGRSACPSRGGWSRRGHARRRGRRGGRWRRRESWQRTLSHRWGRRRHRGSAWSPAWCACRKGAGCVSTGGVNAGGWHRGGVNTRATCVRAWSPAWSASHLDSSREATSRSQEPTCVRTNAAHVPANTCATAATAATQRTCQHVCNSSDGGGGSSSSCDSSSRGGSIAPSENTSSSASMQRRTRAGTMARTWVRPRNRHSSR
jgi:hypothetical protein